MKNTWGVPDEGFVTVNVHFVSSAVPLPIGNVNGVGTIIRDANGNKLWGGMGPMNDQTEVQALTWGL